MAHTATLMCACVAVCVCGCVSVCVAVCVCLQVKTWFYNRRDKDKTLTHVRSSQHPGAQALHAPPHAAAAAAAAAGGHDPGQVVGIISHKPKRGRLPKRVVHALQGIYQQYQEGISHHHAHGGGSLTAAQVEGMVRHRLAALAAESGEAVHRLARWLRNRYPRDFVTGAPSHTDAAAAAAAGQSQSPSPSPSPSSALHVDGGGGVARGRKRDRGEAGLGVSDPDALVAVARAATAIESVSLAQRDNPVPPAHRKHFTAEQRQRLEAAYMETPRPSKRQLKALSRSMGEAYRRVCGCVAVLCVAAWLCVAVWLWLCGCGCGCVAVLFVAACGCVWLCGCS